MTHPANPLPAGPNSGDELLWTAYRYSAGELSAAESLEFEARLADDQEAREALAKAVGLAEIVCSVERDAVPTRAPIMVAADARRSWLQPAGWVAVVAAACVALMFVSRGNDVVPPAGNVAVKAEPVDADTELLFAMLGESDLGQSSIDGVSSEEATSDDVSVLVPSVVSIGFDEATGFDEAAEFNGPVVLDVTAGEIAGNEASLDDQNATPDWLLAAVMESKS